MEELKREYTLAHPDMKCKEGYFLIEKKFRNNFDTHGKSYPKSQFSEKRFICRPF